LLFSLPNTAVLPFGSSRIQRSCRREGTAGLARLYWHSWLADTNASFASHGNEFLPGTSTNITIL